MAQRKRQIAPATTTAYGAAFVLLVACILLAAAPGRPGYATGTSADRIVVERLPIDQYTRTDDQHWIVRLELRDPAVALHPSRTYRLLTGGGQLVPTRRAVSLRHIRNARPNLKIYRAVDDPSYGEVFDQGEHVRLGEPVALFFPGKGHLVFNEARRQLQWQERSSFNLANAPDVYQWRFSSPPRANVQDHRRRAVQTNEDLGLYNLIAERYLVWNPSDGLRWRQPGGPRG
jgi:hypothetical protein